MNEWDTLRGSIEPPRMGGKMIYQAPGSSGEHPNVVRRYLVNARDVTDLLDNKIVTGKDVTLMLYAMSDGTVRWKES